MPMAKKQSSEVTVDQLRSLETEISSVRELSQMAIPLLRSSIKRLESALESEPGSVKSLISYVWSYELKEVSILLRDGVLRLQKLGQFERDGLRSAEFVHKYHVELSMVVQEAVNALEESYAAKLEGKGVLKDGWMHEKTPIPAIIEQVNTIIEQIVKIRGGEVKLDQVAATFADYRSAYIAHMAKRPERGKLIDGSIAGLLDMIQALPDPIIEKNVSKIISRIDELVLLFENQPVLPSYEHIVLEDIDQLKLPVSTIDGRLVYKTIDILSEVSGWISFNMDAHLRNIDKRLLMYRERVSVLLFQLANRLRAKRESEGDQVQVAHSEVTAPILALREEYDKDVTSECFVRLETLTKKLEELLTTSQFYSEKFTFLPTTTLSKMAEHTFRRNLESRYDISRLKDLGNRLRIGVLKNYVEEGSTTAAGYIEKVLSFDPGSEANALFLKKGFLGSTFTIPRKSLEGRIRSHCDLWHAGYSGALLLTGGRGSGRSTLLEKIPLMYPELDSHHLVEDMTIDVKGYKHKMTVDLIKAIKFIIKYQGSDRCMVTIDQLHHYASGTEEAYDLFAELLELIRKQSRKIYFVVAMHSYLEHHLRSFFDLDNVFTETVSADIMSANLIEQALITRAHAVADHDQVGSRGEDFKELARKISRNSRHNIGYAMQLWCMYGTGERDFHVNLKYREEVLRHASILKALIRHGSLYIPAFTNFFNELDARRVRRNIDAMVQLRLLVRPKEGYVAINSFLQPSIEAILDKK